jgi:hypothetical protein
VTDWHSPTKFSEKRGVGGPPPENLYIFEALGLSFWRFLKQIRKQIACKWTVFYKNGYHFTKNNYFITQILPEIVKILILILHDFCLNFTVRGVLHLPPTTPVATSLTTIPCEDIMT